jgi:hypothetical protein
MATNVASHRRDLFQRQPLRIDVIGAVLGTIRSILGALGGGLGGFGFATGLFGLAVSGGFYCVSFGLKGILLMLRVALNGVLLRLGGLIDGLLALVGSLVNAVLGVVDQALLATNAGDAQRGGGHPTKRAFHDNSPC